MTWAMSLLIPVATGMTAAGLAAASGQPFHLSPASLTASSLAAAFLFMILIVALGEEPGWRGFLQTWLNARVRPMSGTLIMAVIWMTWHTPMFMADSTPQTLPPHLLGQTAACFLLVWLTNRARGSVLPAMLCHASANVVNGVLPYRPQTFWLVSGVSTVVAVAVIIGTRGRLGYHETLVDASAPAQQ